MPKTYTIQAPDGHILTIEGPEGATPDEVMRQAQALYKPTEGAQPAPMPTPENRDQWSETPAFQNIMGADPFAMAERAKGLGRAVGRTGMGALQYIQYLTGSKVSPTPISLEPSPNPNQAIGEKIGHAALTAIPAVAASGASLPIQTAIGSLLGGSEGGKPGAVIGGAFPMAAKTIGEGVQYLAQKVDAARIFNKVAGVSAGRKGAETSMETGMVKTQPGNAPLRVLEQEGASPLGKVSSAVFAKPTPEFQQKLYGELKIAGQKLGKHLESNNTPMDLTDTVDLAIPKVRAALKDLGIAPEQLNAVPPVQAHAIRAKIGTLVPKSSWAAESPNPVTEELKDIYFGIGSKIDQYVPGVGPFNKRWQEDFLYAMAHKHQLDLIAAGKKIPNSAAEAFALKVAKILFVGTAGYQALKRLD